VRVRSSEVAEELLARRIGRRLRDGERHAEDRVRTEAALRRRPVEVDERAVDPALVEGIQAADALRDGPVDVGDRVQIALAVVPIGLGVAQLERLVLAGGRPLGTAARPSAPSSRRRRPRSWVPSRIEDRGR
jgi:hypothetical protein